MERGRVSFRLSGEAIPLLARIFAVVDVWDALLSNRPYRKAWTKEQALQYLKDQSGKQFDPAIVERFIALQP
jgi:HD-GYP domain-containing protein (c-di-GMP phosphodiesterase class II)